MELKLSFQEKVARVWACLADRLHTGVLDIMPEIMHEKEVLTLIANRFGKEIEALSMLVTSRERKQLLLFFDHFTATLFQMVKSYLTDKRFTSCCIITE